MSEVHSLSVSERVHAVGAVQVHLQDSVSVCVLCVSLENRKVQSFFNLEFEEEKKE